MTARLMGAALLAAAGVWCGFLQAAALRRSLLRQEELCRMLESVSYELERFRTPLPELFGALAGRMDGVPAELCGQTAQALCAGRGFCEAWEEALEPLPRGEREILLPLGSVLGRYGAEEQTAAAASARRRMEALCAASRSALGERCRVRMGLSAAAGIVLAVMLF